MKIPNPALQNQKNICFDIFQIELEIFPIIIILNRLITLVTNKKINQSLILSK